MNPMDLTGVRYPENYYVNHHIDVKGDRLQAVPRQPDSLADRVRPGAPAGERPLVNPALAEIFVLESDKLLKKADQILQNANLPTQTNKEMLDLTDKISCFVNNAQTFARVSHTEVDLHIRELDEMLKLLTKSSQVTCRDQSQVTCSDQTVFKVDTPLLAKQIGVFQAASAGSFEGIPSTIELSEITGAEFLKALNFLHTRIIEESDFDSLMNAYKVADFLVFDAYKEVLVKILGSQNPVEIAHLAPSQPFVFEDLMHHLSSKGRQGVIRELFKAIHAEENPEIKAQLTQTFISCINQFQISTEAIHLDPLKFIAFLDTVSEEERGMIEFIDFGQAAISSQNLKTLIDSLKYYPNLRYLGIHSKQIRDNDLAQLKQLNLCGLNLSGCIQITNAGIAHLQGMPLTSLNLTNLLNINDAGLAHLQGMPLTSLNLGWCKLITNAGIAHLQGMPLTSLNLANLNINDAGLAHLQGMPLTSLILYGCGQITDAGLAYLQGKPLTSLNLDCCSQITNAGLAYLQGMPLTSLILFKCTNITDAGLAQLQDMPLTSLNLFGCERITDAGLAHLQGMPLTNLNLNNCIRITDACLVHVEHLPLKKLSIINTQVSEDAISLLRTRIPKVI